MGMNGREEVGGVKWEGARLVKFTGELARFK